MNFSLYANMVGFCSDSHKCYTNHPVGAMPSLYIQEYLQIKLTGVSN